MQTSLHCQLDLGEGVVVAGEVADLTIQGAQVRLTQEPCPNLRLHESLKLTIVGRSGWQVVIRACVRHQRTDEKGVHVGLEFKDLGTLYSQFENVLGRFFSRRRWKRYSTLDEGWLRAKLSQGCVVETARVRDLSIGGMAVLLRASTTFKSGTTVEVRLTLPGSRKELVGDAIIRYRHPDDGFERLGLEFDRESSNGFARHRGAIEEYVNSLQHKLERFLQKLAA